MKYGNRSPWKRAFYSPVSVVIAGIALAFLIRSGWNIHDKAMLAEERLDQAKTELADLEQQKSDLTASIGKLSTPAGMEATLREKYHAVKEGESVAVIVDNSPTSTGSSSMASNGEENYSQESDGNTKTSAWGSFLQFMRF